MKLNEAIPYAYGKVKESLSSVLGTKNGRQLPVPHLFQKDVKLPDEVHNEYCFFTVLTMILSYRLGETLSLNDFKNKCVTAGGVREDGYILNQALIANVAEISKVQWQGETITAVGVKKSIESYRPCSVTMSDGHVELISGYEQTPDETIFTLKDPGYQKDEFVSSADWKPYKVSSGVKKYSNRTAKRIGFFKDIA